MKVLLLFFALVFLHLVAVAQETPKRASSPEGNKQLPSSGINSRLTLKPESGTDKRNSGSVDPTPTSTRSRELCDKWLEKNKKEHPACAKQ